MSKSGRVRTSLLHVTGEVWSWSIQIDGRVVEVGGRLNRAAAESELKDRRAMWALAERHRIGVERKAESGDETEADRMVRRQIERAR